MTSHNIPPLGGFFIPSQRFSINKISQLTIASDYANFITRSMEAIHA